MIRTARVVDVPKIYALLQHFANEGLLLGRALSVLYDQLRDFFVYEAGGEIVGVCSLHVCWENLAEIRSLAIAGDFQRRGIGRDLVAACVQEAAHLGISRIFTLTYQPLFFQKQGFVPIDKNELPHKVWSDCVQCPMFPDCKEEALVLELPRRPASKVS